MYVRCIWMMKPFCVLFASCEGCVTGVVTPREACVGTRVPTTALPSPVKVRIGHLVGDKWDGLYRRPKAHKQRQKGEAG